MQFYAAPFASHALTCRQSKPHTLNLYTHLAKGVISRHAVDAAPGFEDSSGNAMPDVKQFLKQFPPLVSLVRATRAWDQQRRQRRRRSPAMYGPLIRDYLQSHALRKLQIGSGPHALPGWLNTDYEPVNDEFAFLDATRRFPLEDQTFDRVFNEHIIEHLSYGDGTFMLRECHRVLKPGGRIRIATPNLKKFVDLYTPDKTELQRRYMQTAIEQFYPEPKTNTECFVINNFLHLWGHLFVYDPPTLRDALERAGFTNVTEHAPGISEDDHLRGLESHGKQIGDDLNNFETMVLEATRPQTSNSASP